MKNRKSQAWGIDLITGIIIFSIGILVFLIYSVNHAGEAKENLEPLAYEGEVLFSNILSEGYPEDWNSDNVVKIGILGHNKINETKLERFYALAQDNYNKTKSLFDTRYDYYFSFSNMDINSTIIEGIGKPGTNITSINAANLIKITRFTVYKNKPVTAYVYVWEE